jgi:RNA polymerase sigma-70 factor (ECF subfamily)
MTTVSNDNPKIDLAREQRFLQLFLSHERRIYGFILALVPIWSDADDLLQETSAVLWRKLDDFEPGTDFLAWALSIARFQVLNYRKKQRQSRARLSNQTVEALADQLMAYRERADARRDALAECLTKLSSRDRELIQMRYQPEATTQSVADSVGRSLKAVYKALNRIHTQLLLCIRQTLASEGTT